MSAMRAMIAGVDRTDVVDLATLSVQDAVGERSTARFAVTDLDGALALQPGQAVELTLDGAVVFGGTIDRIERRRPGVAKPCRALGVECCDWHQLCDRRIVSEAYQATLAGDIVRDLIAKYLGAEGILEIQNIRLAQTPEEYDWAEAMPASVFACPVVSDTLYPSLTLYPC